MVQCGDRRLYKYIYIYIYIDFVSPTPLIQTPDVNQQIPLKTCTNPQGAGTIWEVHQITDKAKFVGNNFVYEMFDDVDECTYNTNTEPIIMSTQAYVPLLPRNFIIFTTF